MTKESKKSRLIASWYIRALAIFFCISPQLTFPETGIGDSVSPNSRNTASASSTVVSSEENKRSALSERTLTNHQNDTDNELEFYSKQHPSKKESIYRSIYNSTSVALSSAVQKTIDNKDMILSNGREAIEAIYALGFEALWPLNLVVVKHIATVLKTLPSSFSTSDGFCGAVEVQLQDGWLVEEIDIKQGSIVNQFQFKKDQNGIHFPREPFNARTVQIRPSPAYFEYYRLYPANYPVDFNITIYHPDYATDSTIQITRSVCSPAKLGRTSATIIDGVKLPLYIRKSELYYNVWEINQLSSEYYTSSYILIPHHPSKFPAPMEE